MSKKQHTKDQSENNEVNGGQEAVVANTAEPEEAPADPAAEPTGAAEAMAKLELELQKATAEREDYQNRWLRAQADFDNFRRRSRQEYEQACLYGGEDLLKKILPALDSLERAVAACSAGAGDSSALQDGVQLTLKQFQSILTAEGLEVIESLNQAFDPQVHEAVLQEQSDEVKEPIVVQELQKGYKYKNRLLRPAMVKVLVP